MQKDLELICALSRGYDGDILGLIKACVNNIDTPVNAWCGNLRLTAANPACLDLFGKTRSEFSRMHVGDVFHPDDHHNGQAGIWIAAAAPIITTGHGRLPIRIWDGVTDGVTDVISESVYLRGWLISTQTVVKQPTLQLVSHSEHSRFGHRARISPLKVL